MPSGGSQEDRPTNPFIRFKHHVDSNIAAGFHTMFGSSPPPDAQPPAEGTPSRTMFWDILGLSSLLHSPAYSPANLNHLPPPIPSDLPTYLDNTIFTYEDAFEDLIAVTQGQPLPDIEHKYNQRKMLRQMFPDGEPGWFFTRRLHASGLLRLPQPPSAQELLQQTGVAPDWDGFHRQLEEKAAEVWRRQPSQRSDPEEVKVVNVGALMDRLLGGGVQMMIKLVGEDEVNKAVGELKKAVEKECRDARGGEAESALNEEQQQQLNDGVRTLTGLFGKDAMTKRVDELERSFENALRDIHEEKDSPLREEQRRQQQQEGQRDGLPNTFDELFSHFKSTFDQGEQSLRTLMKTMTRSEEEALPGYEPKSSPDHQEPEVDEHSYVDEHGNTHRTTTVRVLDRDGNEISKYTSHRVSRRVEYPGPDSGMADGVSGQPEAGEKGDKKGWFWK